jgi:LL-diaminopimelate aminotransferase
MPIETASTRLKQLSDQFFAELNIKIGELKAKGCDIIRLDIGSPDLPPAPFIIDALAKSATRAQNHGYQPHHGIRALREAWATFYLREYGINIDPESEVIPLLGSKEGIFHLTLACVNPGDVVLIPDPGYLTYLQGTLFAGGKPYMLPLIKEKGFLPDLSSIPEDVAARAKILWLNYPNNPTAAVATKSFFKEAVSFAREYGILLCHDAAYTHVTFDRYQATSLLEVPGAREVAVEFNTLSKIYNMAGWRVGVAVGYPPALRSLYTLKTHADSSHFLPIWEAAISAMTGDQSWLEARNEIYRERRDLVLSGLESLGLQAERSKATLYVWSKVPDGWRSLNYTDVLLERAHVSITPGTVFGGSGEGYMRIAFTTPKERISEAMHRIASLNEL